MEILHILFTILLFSCYFNSSIKGFEFTKTFEEKIEYYIGDPMHTANIDCKVNEDAIFLWQECEPIYTIRDWCEESSVDNTTCKEVSRDMFHIDKFISSQISRLSVTNIHPKKVCIRCIATQTNISKDKAKSITSKYIQFYSKDKCLSPSKEQVNARTNKNNHAFCLQDDAVHFLNNKTFLDLCKVPKVDQAISILYNLTNSGKLIAIVQWHAAGCNHKKKCPYGYKIYLHNLLYNTNIFPWCVYTEYLEEKEYYNFTLPDKLEFGFPYKLEIQSLPFSETASLLFTVPEPHQICEDYINRYKVTPKKCEMVSNLTIGDCTEQGDVILSWTRPEYNETKLDNYTYIYINDKLRKIKKEITIFTIKNVTSPVWFEVLLLSRENVNHYRSERKIRRCPHLTTQPTVSLPLLKQNIKSYKELIISTTITLLVGALVAFLLYLYCMIKKAKRVSGLAFGTQISREPLLHLEKDSNVPSVMFVYPHGCLEVENIVLFLAGQLHQLGIEVLVDNLQTTRVADFGLPHVLIEDFRLSSYVVTFCTEKNILVDDLPCHSPYKFVMNQLISADCVYQNGSRYIATHFSKELDPVPLYLRSRAYQLPSSFEAFVNHLLGMQTFHSNFFQKLFSIKVDLVSERKMQLKMLVSALNRAEHDSCNKSTCTKGKKTEVDDSEYPTLETLTQEVKKHEITKTTRTSRNLSENSSLHFSSTESLNNNEDEHREDAV